MDNADYEEKEVSERLKSLWGLSADGVVEYFSSDIYKCWESWEIKGS